MVKLRAREEDDQRKSIVQQVVLDFVSGSSFLLSGREWSYCRTCALNVTNWWCAACGGQHNWKAPNKVLVTLDSADPSEAKVVLRGHAPLHGRCENPFCALKLRASLQAGGDKVVLVDTNEGLQEWSTLKFTSELREFSRNGEDW